MTSSTVIEPLAQALADVAAGLTGLANAVSVKGIVWAPRETGERPAAVVELPQVSSPFSVEDERAGSQLGSVDRTYTFPVSFYFDLSDDVAFSQSQAAEVVEAFDRALERSLDAGGELASNAISGCVVEDVKLVDADPVILEPDSSSARPAIRYACSVEVAALLPA